MSVTRFSVGSYNLYNLVLPEVEYYNNRRYTLEQYQKKKAWAASQLRQMDADVVGFQEVFHGLALQAVIEESGVYDGAAVLVGAETGDSPVVGLASRFAVLDHGVVSDFPPEAQLDYDGAVVPLHNFSRPVLWADLQITDQIIARAFVVHLKSKRPLLREGADSHDPLEDAIGKARSLIRRAAEAIALRCLLLDTLKGGDKPVIVIGDINDAVTAVTSDIVSGSPPWRRFNQDLKERYWDVLLYNVKDIQARQSPHDVYYTHIYNGLYESLDHILVSQEFVRQNPDHVGRVEYVLVFNDHLRDDTFSWDTAPIWQSDHGQVVAMIRLA